MCLVRGRHDTVSLEALKYPENQSKLRQGQHALTSVLLTLFWQKRERFEALQRYNTFLWSQSNLKTSRISFFPAILIMQKGKALKTILRFSLITIHATTYVYQFYLPQ